MDREEIVKVDALNKKGVALASLGNTRIEVRGGLPGDELKVRVRKARRARAEILGIITPAPSRVPLICPHAPSCGGCTWQQMDYAAQLEEKRARVQALFPTFPCPSPLPASSLWHYRNKMEFSFSQNKAGERFLGLVLAGSKGHVFNLTECSLVSPWFARTLSCVRTWWQKSSLSAYRLDNTGSLRTLTMREGKRTGDKLLLLTVSGNPDYALNREQLKGFVEAAKSSLPQEEWKNLSLFLQIQQVKKGSPTQFFEMHLFGKDHLTEILTLPLDPPLTLHFTVSPTSFFQPNPAMAEQLYSTALNMLSLPKEHVLDLYAGTATLSMVLAPYAKKVTAIELNPHACFDAESNKELNGFSHIEILCGDVGEHLPRLKERPDLVLLDPPRVGLGEKALSSLIALGAPEILYISCHPPTQATDIEALLKAGYALIALQPVDQFPHTPHIENIALLRRS